MRVLIFEQNSCVSSSNHATNHEKWNPRHDAVEAGLTALPVIRARDEPDDVTAVHSTTLGRLVLERASSSGTLLSMVALVFLILTIAIVVASRRRLYERS
jgi:hypothetical protein